MPIILDVGKKRLMPLFSGEAIDRLHGSPDKRAPRRASIRGLLGNESDQGTDFQR